MLFLEKRLLYSSKRQKPFHLYKWKISIRNILINFFIFLPALMLLPTLSPPLMFLKCSDSTCFHIRHYLLTISVFMRNGKFSFPSNGLWIRSEGKVLRLKFMGDFRIQNPLKSNSFFSTILRSSRLFGTNEFSDSTS